MTVTMTKNVITHDVHKIICGVLKDYNLSDGHPGYMEHYDIRTGELVKSQLSIEGELIFAIEKAFKIGAQSVVENKSVREILDSIKYGN